MKTFKSARYSSLSVEFVRTTRTDAINAAIQYVTNLIGSDNVLDGKRFTWRADDQSGFTLVVYHTAVKLAAKWNASRN